MKGPECLAVESLQAVLAAPADDPRHHHLASCPRCRALAAAYQNFVAEQPTRREPLTGELQEAERIADLVCSLSIPEPAPADPTRRQLTPWLRVLVPVAVAASLILSLVIAWPDPTEPVRLVRGEADVPAGITGAAARLLPDGRIDMVWSCDTAVDSFVVELLADDLALVGRHRAEDRAGDTVALPPGEPRPRFWRVVGYREGGPVTRSKLVSMPANTPAGRE